MGYRLGVDLGTTYTAAAVNVDGRVEMLGLGIRAMQVPSVVFVRDDGEIVVGEAAEQQGGADPSRLVREFKRRIGDSVPLVVGGSPFSAQALSARLLAWVVGVATQRQGGPPEHVCVTYPANWGPFKRDLLGQAIEMAGLRGTETSTCTEPEAAAIAYASRDRVAEGARVAVYDLGGGTFDAAVLAREGAGFRLVGSPEGVEHLGGIDFDEAVFRHVLTSLGPEVAALDDTDPATATGLARLRRDCVEAKEVLSFSVDTVVPVALPGITRSVRLTRGEFEDMLRPAIAETVSAMRRVLEASGVGAADVAAMVLVGGSSRIPLVSEMLSAAFGRPLALDNHPKHDVALGAAIRGTPAAQPAGVAATGAPGDGMAAAAAVGPALSGPPSAAPAAVPSAQPPPPAWAGGPPPYAPPPSFPPADPFARRGPDGTAPLFTGPPPSGPGNGGPPPPPPGPSPDWRPPTAVGPHSTDPGAPQKPGTAPSTGGSGRRRALAIGSGVVVALAITGGIVLTRNRAEPTPVPIPVPTIASAPTPSAAPTTPAVAPLPQSAQPLANDVIVWPHNVGGNWDITTITTAGAVGQNLTDSPDEDNFPVISPDRRTIIYLHRTSPTTRELRVMGADGTGDRPLLATVPAGCADLTRPAFGDQPVPQLVMPCLDPVTGATSLKLVGLDGTAYKVVDQGALSDPALTPDGRFVVYWHADAAGQEGGALYRAPLTGQDPPAPITAGGPVHDNDPAVSPTGDRVAFTRAGKGIWTVGLGGDNQEKQLTKQNGDQDPSWSPDGNQITFKRQDQVWIMNADGSDAHRVSKPGDVGTAAAWSPR
ncbi:MAG: Hsp70 family protein [Pseudonocardia sp.]|nr:Hsp70 family protein [Pseudonocardia sp.]